MCALYGIGIVTGSPQPGCVSAPRRVVDQPQFDNRSVLSAVSDWDAGGRPTHPTPAMRRNCPSASTRDCRRSRPRPPRGGSRRSPRTSCRASRPTYRFCRRRRCSRNARPTGAALHHQRQRVVQLRHGVRRGDLLHFQRISIQRGPGFVFDREHRLVRRRKSAAREYAVDLEHRQRRHVDGAEQQRRKRRWLARFRRARRRARRPDRRQQLDRVARSRDSTNLRARAPAVPDRGPRCRSCAASSRSLSVSDGSSGASSTIDARW